MTEQERVDKLKARMSRWQEYVDKPQAEVLSPIDAPPDVIDAIEVPFELHQSRTRRSPERPQSGSPLEPTPLATQMPRESGAYASAPDPLSDLQEARIADLKVAIVREREQADRLAEEVKRAQNLHAATIYSHLSEEKDRPIEARLKPLYIPETPPAFYGDARRRNLAVVIGLLLVITSVCSAAFFMTR
ncbi:MAG: hypothetical protein JWN14_2730 [Chthonomonadales bacterium]|nr:hypothetical protein [Chthonomonadales bacterium]